MRSRVTQRVRAIRSTSRPVACRCADANRTQLRAGVAISEPDPERTSSGNSAGIRRYATNTVTWLGFCSALQV